MPSADWPTLCVQELAHREDVPLVCVSQYEVYNEQIYDLLDVDGGGLTGARQRLQLKEDPQGRVFVGGLSEVRLETCLREDSQGRVFLGKLSDVRPDTQLREDLQGWVFTGGLSEGRPETWLKHNLLGRLL